MTDAEWLRAAHRDDLRGDGPHAISAGDTDLVVVRTSRGLRAFEGRCPHRGALLGEGELSEGAIVCRNHRWRFDAETGARIGGPECLRACPLKEEGSDVLVRLDAIDAAQLNPSIRGARQIRELPGPRAFPVVGTPLALDRLHLQIEAWGREYGMPYRVAFGPVQAVVFGEMDDMKPVLMERPELFQRASNMAPVFREIGIDGVFSAEGAAWRPQRRLSMEALSHRHLKSFYPTLATVAERLRHRWDRAAARGEVLDLPAEMKRFTVDVTSQLVFGYDINTLGTDRDVIQDKLGLLFPALNRRLFAAIPWWRLVRLPHDRQLDRAMAELRIWIDGLVAEARQRLHEDPARAEHPATFLESMLISRDEHGQPFSDEAIFGNAMTMLVAGEDTTAYTLAWCGHHLMESPSDLRRLQIELGDVLGGGAVPRSIEDVNRLSFAGAVANETMRLRPVAPLLFLEPCRDTVVGGIAIPRGTLVVLAIRAPAVIPENFGDPTVFRPARWVDESATGGAHDPSAHQPFGSGPRICPGRSLALLEMRLALATIFQNFDLERVGRATEVKEVFSFTMLPEGLRVRVAPRRVAGGSATATSGAGRA
jgi:cytochrome P450/nitrite reductase/ring-hydroxylating ferredoxin subunit